MRYAQFTRADFPTYCAWYADAELNRQLGPMDEAWLEHVLGDRGGVQRSFFLDDELVAVAGVALPPEPGLPHVITDLAVHPGQRGQGIGSAALALLLAAEEFADTAGWEASVSPDNPGAQRFLQGRGWASVAAPSDEDEMLTYRYGAVAVAAGGAA